MDQTGESSGDAVVVRGCAFPIRLHYDIDNHIWYEPLASDEIRIGMTWVGAALASFRIFAVTPRRVGREFAAGTSIATIESSKWVGPARVVFDGVITKANDALSANPAWLAEDPYGAGWMIEARPTSPEPLSRLVTGESIGPAYLAWMNANDFPGCDAERT